MSENSLAHMQKSKKQTLDTKPVLADQLVLTLHDTFWHVLEQDNQRCRICKGWFRIYFKTKALTEELFVTLHH